ncbi:hypothetical protein Hanom_Chr12g01107411 [Helianthus anomalus]
MSTHSRFSYLNFVQSLVMVTAHASQSLEVKQARQSLVRILHHNSMYTQMLVTFFLYVDLKSNTRPKAFCTYSCVRTNNHVTVSSKLLVYLVNDITMHKMDITYITIRVCVVILICMSISWFVAIYSSNLFHEINLHLSLSFTFIHTIIPPFNFVFNH